MSKNKTFKSFSGAPVVVLDVITMQQIAVPEDDQDWMKEIIFFQSKDNCTGNNIYVLYDQPDETIATIVTQESLKEIDIIVVNNEITDNLRTALHFISLQALIDNCDMCADQNCKGRTEDFDKERFMAELKNHTLPA